MVLGALLAILILILFLKDGRPTLIIACAIPLSVVFAVVLMYFTGITLNIISMSGLALGIGMLVDNSIVVIENIYRLRSEGMSIKKAAVYGAGQVGGAITASTLTTICVFAPIVFTDGITKQLFVDMGLTIAYTLVASLIVALTLVPAMSSAMLEKSNEKKHPFIEKVQNGYGAMLSKLLRYKPIVFLVCIALLVASVVLAMSRGTAFMPEMTSTQLTVTMSPKEGETKELAEMTEMSDTLVERLMEIPEIETVGAMAGSGSTMSMLSSSDSNSITMYVLLDEDAKISNDEITNQILEAAADLDCQVSADGSSMDLSSLMGSGLSIDIKGRDLETMQQIAADVAEILAQTEGVIDIEDGLDDMTNELVISVDKEKAAEYNMTVAQVFQLVYSKMASSTSAAVISTDVKDYEVYLQSEEQTEVTLDDLKNLTFTYTDSESGEEEEIPLADIVSFRETQELSVITRSAQTRYITVSAGIDDDHNVGLVGDEVQKALDKYECPEGYSIEMSGEDETINDAMEQVLLMLLLAVILIYLIMVAQFQSLLSPFIIMFTIPLAFTGGFLALYLTGNEVSVIGMIGFVMLSGIIVNNGIVLIDYIIQRRREGISKKEAIVDAAKTRLRPVLMTALTTIISMSTMALGMGNGTEMMQPMAIVVVGGMIYGTLLTLIVVPCIYDAFNREKDMTEEEL
jgi:HAE1 family hydrophobic/amphiphilic exporter-1